MDAVHQQLSPSKIQQNHLNPEEPAELPPGNPAADEEKRLLEEAAADLEAVIRHWQSYNW